MYDPDRNFRKRILLKDVDGIGRAGDPVYIDLRGDYPAVVANRISWQSLPRLLEALGEDPEGRPPGPILRLLG